MPRKDSNAMVKGVCLSRVYIETQWKSGMEKHVLCDRPLRGSWFLQLSGWRCVRWSVSRLSFLLIRQWLIPSWSPTFITHTHKNTQEKTKNMHLICVPSGCECILGGQKIPHPSLFPRYIFLCFIVHKTKIVSQNTYKINNKPLLNKQHKLITHL